MKFAFNDNIAGVHLPPISEVREWAARRSSTMPLVDLCQAVPDYAPAPQLVERLREVVSDPLASRYSPDEGLAEVREAVAERYLRRYGAPVSPESVCLTVGASQAFWLALTVLCRAGDEVVVQAPYYFDHPMALAILGIRGIFAPYREENGGLPDPEEIEALLTPRTRAILLVTPSNPTGVVTPPQTLERLFDLARSRGIALVLDETYADFIPGRLAPHALFSRDGWDDTLVHIMSFGKTFALTGYRAGCLVASPLFLRQALKAQDTMVVCQPRVTQQAVLFGARHLDAWVEENCRMMERRHDLFRGLFLRPGNPFRLCASGSFFAWIRHPWPKATGREAARRLVEEGGILCLPGEVFGPGLEGYLRLAFGNIHEETVPEAVERFRAFLSR